MKEQDTQSFAIITSVLAVIIFASLRLIIFGELSEIAKDGDQTQLLISSILIFAYYLIAFNIAVFATIKKYPAADIKKLTNNVFSALIILRIIAALGSTTSNDFLTRGGYSAQGESLLNYVDFWLTVLIAIGLYISKKVIESNFRNSS